MQHLMQHLQQAIDALDAEITSAEDRLESLRRARAELEAIDGAPQPAPKARSSSRVGPPGEARGHRRGGRKAGGRAKNGSPAPMPPKGECAKSDDGGCQGDVSTATCADCAFEVTRCAGHSGARGATAHINVHRRWSHR